MFLFFKKNVSLQTKKNKEKTQTIWINYLKGMTSMLPMCQWNT